MIVYSTQRFVFCFVLYFTPRDSPPSIKVTPCLFWDAHLRQMADKIRALHTMHEPNLCFVCNPSLYIEAKSFQLGQTDGKEAPPPPLPMKCHSCGCFISGHIYIGNLYEHFLSVTLAKASRGHFRCCCVHSNAEIFLKPVFTLKAEVKKIYSSMEKITQVRWQDRGCPCVCVCVRSLGAVISNTESGQQWLMQVQGLHWSMRWS